MQETSAVINEQNLRWDNNDVCPCGTDQFVAVFIPADPSEEVHEVHLPKGSQWDNRQVHPPLSLPNLSCGFCRQEMPIMHYWLRVLVLSSSVWQECLGFKKAATMRDGQCAAPSIKTSNSQCLHFRHSISKACATMRQSFSPLKPVRIGNQLLFWVANKTHQRATLLCCQSFKSPSNMLSEGDGGEARKGIKQLLGPALLCDVHCISEDPTTGTTPL